MQKEFEKQEKMRSLDEENRKKYEEELKQQQQKHNQHERIHHPGNKAQLEEGNGHYYWPHIRHLTSPLRFVCFLFFIFKLVWEKQDHMDAADFEPKKFFMMHGTYKHFHENQTYKMIW